MRSLKGKRHCFQHLMCICCASTETLHLIVPRTKLLTLQMTCSCNSPWHQCVRISTWFLDRWSPASWSWCQLQCHQSHHRPQRSVPVRRGRHHQRLVVQIGRHRSSGQTGLHQLQLVVQTNHHQRLGFARSRLQIDLRWAGLGPFQRFVQTQSLHRSLHSLHSLRSLRSLRFQKGLHQTGAVQTIHLQPHHQCFQKDCSVRQRGPLQCSVQTFLHQCWHRTCRHQCCHLNFGINASCFCASRDVESVMGLVYSPTEIHSWSYIWVKLSLRPKRPPPVLPKPPKPPWGCGWGCPNMVHDDEWLIYLRNLSRIEARKQTFKTQHQFKDPKA